MTDEELIIVTGGASRLSGTFINAITKAVGLVLDIGRAVGSAIRSLTSGKKCS